MFEQAQQIGREHRCARIASLEITNLGLQIALYAAQANIKFAREQCKIATLRLGQREK